MKILPTTLIGTFTVLLSTTVFCLDAAAQARYVQPAPIAPIAPQSEEVAIVESSTQVLNEIMAAPGTGIPRALLHDAEAIVIAPGLLKGGFVIGVRHGRGVLVMRDGNNGWRAPSFISITGGSIGWQIGVQATDIIMVFKTKQSVQKLATGKFTIGGDVAATAGPVGREASAATDVQLKSEIYSYSRSRGLFAGAALDGSAVSMDNAATLTYYRGTGMLPGDGPAMQPPQLPGSAANLLGTIAAYADQPAGMVPVAAQPTAATSGAPAATNGQPVFHAPTGGSVTDPATKGPTLATGQLPDLAAIRGQLADSSRRLAGRVDSRWQNYLALPAEMYVPNQSPRPEAVAATVDRFNAVATNPKYSTLTSRPEFQETFGLLKAYRDLQSAGGKATLALPPPPQ
jgi:lipid-binding SYLF domain-containing protein